MKELRFIEKNKLEWVETPAPRLKEDGDALVRPIMVTTCDIDAPIVCGQVPMPGNFPLGHEFLAEVVEVSSSVSRFQPGQVVCVPFQISCGACEYCARGLTGACKNVPPRSSYGLGSLGGEWGGAFSDLVRVPFADAMLVAIPDGVPLEAVVSLSDNIPDAYRAVGPQLLEMPGAPVLIVGGGGPIAIALYAVAIARALGASVDYLDHRKEQLAIAESLGAHVIEGPPPKKLGPYPIVVDASSSAAGLACALRSVTPYGVCTSVAIYFKDTPIPLWDMYSTGIRFITGRCNARADIPAVLELIQAKKLEPQKLSTRSFSFEQAAEVLGEGLLKPVFRR